MKLPKVFLQGTYHDGLIRPALNCIEKAGCGNSVAAYAVELDPYRYYKLIQPYLGSAAQFASRYHGVDAFVPNVLASQDYDLTAIAQKVASEKEVSYEEQLVQVKGELTSETPFLIASLAGQRRALLKAMIDCQVGYLPNEFEGGLSGMEFVASALKAHEYGAAYYMVDMTVDGIAEAMRSVPLDEMSAFRDSSLEQLSLIDRGIEFVKGYEEKGADPSLYDGFSTLERQQLSMLVRTLGDPKKLFYDAKLTRSRLQRSFPNITRVLHEEREKVMARYIVEAAAAHIGETIVVVVGGLHVSALEALLDQDGSVDALVVPL